jgi:hypothetical protein
MSMNFMLPPFPKLWGFGYWKGVRAPIEWIPANSLPVISPPIAQLFSELVKKKIVVIYVPLGRSTVSHIIQMDYVTTPHHP